MAELDYYSVMQKRIEYFAKKYDPYNRYLPREEPVQEPEEVKVLKFRKSPNKAIAAFSYLYSLLF